MKITTKRQSALIAAIVAAFAAIACGEETQPESSPQPMRITVQPESFALTGTRQRVQFVVTGVYADGSQQDLSRAAAYQSGDESIVRIAHGVAFPVADGETTVMVAAGGQEASVPIRVSGQDAAERVSFRYGVLAALTKQGCNSGGCHGAPSGKGGFRMSLFAYDPELDGETLIREHFSRRTNTQDPTLSLLLQKPLMQVAHGGGRQLRPSDAAYSILHDWIAEGCRRDPPEAAPCTGIAVYPAERELQLPADLQQLQVLARFADGGVRDITHVATYSSSDESVANIDPHGIVTAAGMNGEADGGETAILVRFLEHAATARLTFLRQAPGFAWNDPAEENDVDRHVFAKLKKLRILPSARVGDEEFVRRVYLDVIGLLPTVEETAAFLADERPDRRGRLIDELLDRPEYALFWATRWADLLRVSDPQISAAGVHKFHQWLVDAVRENMPYDRFVAALLTAEGNTFANPPANYYRTAADVNDCTETTAQLFLGIRIQCAKCHNHPYERWTQDNYYGMAALFQRVQRTPLPHDNAVRIWVAREGEITQPRTGKVSQPWLPQVGTFDVPGEQDRRGPLVEWMISPKNPYFARVEVNRIWSYLTGRGIVDPIDDFRESNPPSNPELLDALAADFVAHGFDRRRVIRTILNSAVYQTSSRQNETNGDDARYFSHLRTRRLSAEQLMDAICQVTGVEHEFPGLPAGTRATQLPSPEVDVDFLKTFGKPPRDTACECERGTSADLSQTLAIINGGFVQEKVECKTNRVHELVAAGKSNAEILTNLYLAAYSRRPNERELEVAENYVAGEADRALALEDILWAILNSKEFLFQH